MRRWRPSFDDPRLYTCDARLYSAGAAGSSRAKPYDSRGTPRSLGRSQACAHLQRLMLGVAPQFYTLQ
eukprot:3623788-Pleurochrysis_carterae.AAC.1